MNWIARAMLANTLSRTVRFSAPLARIPRQSLPWLGHQTPSNVLPMIAESRQFITRIESLRMFRNWLPATAIRVW